MVDDSSHVGQGMGCDGSGRWGMSGSDLKHTEQCRVDKLP